MKSSQELRLPKGNPYKFDHSSGDCAHHIDRKVCTSTDYLQKMLGHAVKNAAAALEQLKKRTGCDSEICVIERSDEISYTERQHIIKEFFKPAAPKGETEWLSNFDIDDVLDQVEKKYDSFLHIDFHMRDFEIFKPPRKNLTNLDISKELSAGKTTWGVVFNTDYSSGNGIHWFAVFGDFSRKPYTVEYFNSSGQWPLPEIEEWMTKTAVKWSIELNEPVEPVIVSRVQYQEDNHSCGTYALYYIMSRLAGTELAYFTSNKAVINDDLMRDFRKYLFRSST